MRHLYKILIPILLFYTTTGLSATQPQSLTILYRYSSNISSKININVSCAKLNGYQQLLPFVTLYPSAHHTFILTNPICKYTQMPQFCAIQLPDSVPQKYPGTSWQWSPPRDSTPHTLTCRIHHHKHTHGRWPYKHTSYTYSLHCDAGRRTHERYPTN